MASRFNVRSLALIAAGAAVGALAVVAPSAGANSPPRHVTTVNHLAMDSSAFIPDGLHTTTQDYFNQWDPAALSNQDTGRCFDAAVALPTSAVLKRVTFYYTAGSAQMSVELNRQNLTNHTEVTLFTFDTTIAGSPTYTSMTRGIPAQYAVVSNLTYAYSFGVCPSASTTFTGLVVTYTTTT